MKVRIKTLIKNLPILGNISTRLYYSLFNIRPFPGSGEYWEQRYQAGGTSGAGSYDRLAEFKAEILNAFVAEHNIASVIELGCGDGNQLALARYPHYIGLDVSGKAIELCKKRFVQDNSKSFFLYHPLYFVDHHNLFSADLVISLDVIFHLVEDDIFLIYLDHLFRMAREYVVIYSSNFDSPKNYHERHRNFTAEVKKYYPDWELNRVIKNKYPYNAENPNYTSLSDFYIYKNIKEIDECKTR